MQHSSTATAVAKINNRDILLIREAEQFVPLKPICEALGITFRSQLKKLENDPVLGSVVTLRVTTGADNKQYEMVCLPSRYIFGWLFRIDSRNVKPEASETMQKFQRMCYDVLYDQINVPREYIRYKEERIEELNMLKAEARARERESKTSQQLYDRELADIQNLTVDEWRSMKRQLELDFDSQPVQEGRAV